MLSFMKQGRPSTKPRTDFGRRMADARERAGITQQQLAEKLGTSQRAVAHWERDPVALRPDQIAAVADALNVTTDELLGRAARIRGRQRPRDHPASSVWLLRRPTNFRATSRTALLSSSRHT